MADSVMVANEMKMYLSEHQITEMSSGNFHQRFSISDQKEAEWCQPFGSIHGFKEASLATEFSLIEMAEMNMHLVLIPIVGAINFELEDEVSMFEVGSCLVQAIPKGMFYKVSNPIEADPVHYLQMVIQSNEMVKLSPIELELCQNELFEIYSSPSLGRLLIGKYDGRVDNELLMTQGESSAFCYVLNGAFEIQNCLLEKSDGLAISVHQQLAFESLSHEAILLIYVE